MEVVYKAFDGTEFREAAACMRYEENVIIYKAYGPKGITNNVDEAYVVYFPEYNSAEQFIKRCETECSSYDGIGIGDVGLFIWDDSEERYGYVSERVLDAIKFHIENR